MLQEFTIPRLMLLFLIIAKCFFSKEKLYL